MEVINCYYFGTLLIAFMTRLRRSLSQYAEYEVLGVGDDNFIVNLVINGKSTRINVTTVWKRNMHVCVVDMWMSSSSYFSDYVKYQVSRCKKYFPTVPIVIANFYGKEKHRLRELKKAELAGDKMMNRKIGDELARKLGAVKYIEWSFKTGRGAKILIDEIAFAGLGKIIEIEERIKIANCFVL